MILPQLKLGKRYKLPHGYGELIGHEMADPHNPGFLIFSDKLPVHDTPSMRYVFDLEPGHTWAFESMNYYAWGKQIQEDDRESGTDS